MSDDDCNCRWDGDLFACFGGEVYGPCSSDQCGGVCEPTGRCQCECH